MTQTEKCVFSRMSLPHLHESKVYCIITPSTLSFALSWHGKYQCNLINMNDIIEYSTWRWTVCGCSTYSLAVHYCNQYHHWRRKFFEQKGAWRLASNILKTRRNMKEESHPRGYQYSHIKKTRENRSRNIFIILLSFLSSHYPGYDNEMTTTFHFWIRRFFYNFIVTHTFSF